MNFLRKTLNQIHRCFENKHSSNLKVFVSQFGNINSDGFFIYYALPGVDLTYWKEISFEEFTKASRPESIDLIGFVIKHHRLPNYTMNDIPVEFKKEFP